MSEVRRQVREAYGRIAREGAATTGCCAPSCCSPEPTPGPEQMSKRMGYSDAELQAVPEGANLGLGCGNPQAIARLEPGQTVLDLGSGGGFDCFLAAARVGATGQVIGVDMTHDMLALARANAKKIGAKNVSFRLGEIEALPVADGTVDVILSNCVINLSPDKEAVFREAFRVLKPGGRLAISDVVATVELPEELKSDSGLLTGCMAGAALIGDVEAMLANAGFTEIAVTPVDSSREIIAEWDATRDLSEYVVSATIEAVRPA